MPPVGRMAFCAWVDVAPPTEPTAGFHPVMWPLSLTKMNRAGPDEPSWAVTTKPVVGFDAWPVGSPPGRWTTRGTIDWVPPWTPPAYSVVTFLPLSDTHSGLVPRYDAPQALTRCGSVIWAQPGTSE